MTRKRKSTAETTPEPVTNDSEETSAKALPTPKSAKKLKKNHNNGTPEKEAPEVSEDSPMETPAGDGKPGKSSRKRSRAAKKRKAIEEKNGEENKQDEEEKQQNGKEKRLRKKIKVRKAPPDAVVPPEVRLQLALDYLEKWNTDKSHWRYNKQRQNYFLKNMYDTEKISNDTFVLLCEYLEPSKGDIRTSTVTDAKAQLDTENAKDDEEQDDVIIQRCEKIIKLLSN